MKPTRSETLRVITLPRMPQTTYLYKDLVQFHQCNILSHAFEAPGREDQVIVPE